MERARVSSSGQHTQRQATFWGWAGVCGGERGENVCLVDLGIIEFEEHLLDAGFATEVARPLTIG